MRKKATKDVVKKDSASWRNEARMKLLAALPPFQKDVATIREECGISESDFKRKEINLEDPLQERKLTATELSRKKKDALGKKVLLEKGVIKLKNKYKIPENFDGLKTYILRDKIVVPPQNWKIEIEINQDAFGSIYVPGELNRYPSHWISVKTFAPLGKAEMKAIADNLSRMELRLPQEILIPFGVRNQFDRDLQIFKKLSTRTSHPKKVKEYKSEKYLAAVMKDKFTSDKEKRRLERKYKHQIKVGYDVVIARDIAKEFKVKPDAIRKAKERVEKLAKAWFGVDLRPGQ